MMKQEDDASEQSSRSDDQSDISVGNFIGLAIQDLTLYDPCVFVGCIQELCNYTNSVKNLDTITTCKHYRLGKM